MLDVRASKLKRGDLLWISLRGNRLLAKVQKIRLGCQSELIPAELQIYARKEPVLCIDIDLGRNVPLRDIIETDLTSDWRTAFWTLRLNPAERCNIQPHKQKRKFR